MPENRMTRRKILLSGAAAIVSGYPVQKTQAADSQQFSAIDHDHFMRRAIELAKKVPDCPFGAVVVNRKTNKVVAEGWVEIEKHPIWHGEMTALRNCPTGDEEFRWKDMCLYTTGESCPMCQAAVIWSQIPLSVYGSSIPFLQTCGFGQIDIRAQAVVDASHYGTGKCTIIGGVLSAECNELFKHAAELNRRKS